MPRTEGKVKRLSGEVTDNVRGVSSPERHDAFVGVCASEAVGDALVRSRQAALLDLEIDCEKMLPQK